MILSIYVKGAVQGVGYRPFIYIKATEYGLKGYVKNIGAAVEILVKGSSKNVFDFLHCIENEHPQGSFILSITTKEIKESDCTSDYSDFQIYKSNEADISNDLPVLLPDIGICDTCMKEMVSIVDRRYRYPLISCACCGPRFSIINSLPYDRVTTNMKFFDMCSDCEREYRKGRRLHAQTISCHNCGPQYYYKNDTAAKDMAGENAIKEAINELLSDNVIGLKGVSGYQLICRPDSKAADRLRDIKLRENKPFAVMFPDVDSIKEWAKVNEKEEELLKSSARPIVLLEAVKKFDYSVSKDSRYIGAFLPSAGIHKILCDEVGPLIVTSANRSDEPIIIKDNDFFETFLTASKVKGVLYHDRYINIPQDDSVVYVNNIKNKGYICSFIRRARGYVPLPVIVDNKAFGDKKILSFGGDLKNTFSFAYKDKIIVSQYLGDLQELENSNNLRNLINRFSELFKFEPDIICCDRHPLYISAWHAKNYAEEYNKKLIKIQHHHAHILSVMAENSLKSCIGVSFDGTGYGDDGNIWGGEFLLCNNENYLRAGHLSYVKLCGGDTASKNADLVKKCYMAQSAPEIDINDKLISSALKNNINCTLTSSAGRLFDAVSSLLGIKDYNSYEGECATNLEKAAWEFDGESFPRLSFDINKTEDGIIIDQTAFFRKLYHEKTNGKYDCRALAYSFHLALSDAIIKSCILIKEYSGENKVCLSGGVFANRLLLKTAYEGLVDEDFEVYINEIVPCTDSGISLGQAYFALFC